MTMVEQAGPGPPEESLPLSPLRPHIRPLPFSRSGPRPMPGQMRNVVLSGVTVVFGAVLLLGYLTISLAARTALAMAPADPPLP